MFEGYRICVMSGRSEIRFLKSDKKKSHVGRHKKKKKPAVFYRAVMNPTAPFYDNLTPFEKKFPVSSKSTPSRTK